MISVVDLDSKAKQISKPWSPIEVARVNDQVVRMALVHGEYHWHKHTNEDELFYVYRGSITIELKDQPDILLDERQMAVVPRGLEHRPKSADPSYLLVFEPSALQSRGD